jgi:site-specific recombinase XerD
MRRYLRQLGTFLAPRSVDAADSALRQFARWMLTEAGLAAAGDIRRDDIEDYKVWLAARPRGGGRTITAETHRQRMRTVRQFFERIIEKAGAAAEVPRRQGRGQADDRRPGQQRPPRPAGRGTAGPHRDAGRRAG